MTKIGMDYFVSNKKRRSTMLAAFLNLRPHSTSIFNSRQHPRIHGAKIYSNIGIFKDWYIQIFKDIGMDHSKEGEE